MINKILTCLLLFGLMISGAYAIEGQQNKEVLISHLVTLQDLPNPVLTVNITVKDPDSIPIVNYAPMTFNATSQQYFYLMQSSLTSKIGTYRYEITATNGVENKTSSFKLLVTPSGSDDSGLGYIGLLSLGIIFSVVIIIFGFYKGDPWIAVMGSVVLFLFGLFTLINGIGNYRNDLTMAISFIIIGFGSYISIRTGIDIMEGSI